MKVYKSPYKGALKPGNRVTEGHVLVLFLAFMTANWAKRSPCFCLVQGGNFKSGTVCNVC